MGAPPAIEEYGGGILGIIVLVLDIWAILRLFQTGVPVLHKILWALLIFFFPVGGLIIWCICGPGSTKGGTYQTIV